MSNIEKGLFLSLFNRGGYVLNFSTVDFDVFTMQSIGEALCEKHQLSKGKSLKAYIYEADEADAAKLLFDLLDYYEAHYGPEYDPDQADSFRSYAHEKGMRSNYLKCKEIVERERSSTSAIVASAIYLKSSFNSEYMNSQIDLLMQMRERKPTEAIGKSKELIESCCKTILNEQGIEWDKEWTVAQLAKNTAKVLSIDANDLDSNSEPERLAKQILGSLQGIASGVAEFRNKYGSGHGKEATFQELPIRHAKLAVGASITLVEYYWETYQWRREEGRLK